MLQICPKLPNQQFKELPFKEAILTFLRDLSHSGEIKVITDVNVNKLHQSWRSFAAVINKCPNGKSTEYDILRHLKLKIPRACTNKEERRLSYRLHEDTQLYGAILPNELTNEDIRNSKSYKEYYAITLGAEPPKTKATVKKKQVGSDKTKTPLTAKGKRLKTSAKAAKPAKKKQPAKTSKAKGLTVLSGVALIEAKQMKLATKRSLIQTHSSHASGSGADEGTGDIPGVPDVPTYGSDDEQISKSSEEEEDDEVGMNEDDDNNDDDTNNDDDVDKDDEDDDAVIQDDENPDDANQDDDDEQTDSDSDEESDDESNKERDKEVQGVNIEEEEMDEEATHEEDKANELYKDVNINPEGRDTQMTDASMPTI
ncbi:hypothetical protein Tco_0259685 [Tanacetum coccineum]